MKKNKGFALLELLIVVVIIGILASLAIPRYQKTVESSNAAEAYSNLGTLRKAVWEYRAKYGVFPDDSSASGGFPSKLSVEPPNTTYYPIPNSKFSYWIANIDNDAATFDIGATRQGGLYNGNYIYIDENGNIYEEFWLQ